jgi:hypothetical protein
MENLNPIEPLRVQIKSNIVGGHQRVEDVYSYQKRVSSIKPLAIPQNKWCHNSQDN